MRKDRKSPLRAGFQETQRQLVNQRRFARATGTRDAEGEGRGSRAGGRVSSVEGPGRRPNFGSAQQLSKSMVRKSVLRNSFTRQLVWPPIGALHKVNNFTQACAREKNFINAAPLHYSGIGWGDRSA